jgi:uncharacterized membrane protein
MQPNPPMTPPPPPHAQPVKSDTTAKIVYVLYLVSLPAGGLPSLVGVVLAYVNVGDAPEPLRTHYRFQIRTFWIAALYGAIGTILALFGVWLVPVLFVALWLVVRCVKGLKHLGRHEPYPNVTTWLW